MVETSCGLYHTGIPQIQPSVYCVCASCVDTTFHCLERPNRAIANSNGSKDRAPRYRYPYLPGRNLTESNLNVATVSTMQNVYYPYQICNLYIFLLILYV